MTKRTMTRTAVLALLIAAVVGVLEHAANVSPEALESWLQSFGPEAPLVFVVTYVLGTVLFFPGAALTLAGGAIFGTVWGGLYSVTGATVGAACSFLVARYLASDLVSSRVHAKLPKLMRGIESEGWKFVALMRLAPIVPFNALNYALGLTRVKFSQYVLASLVFMLPGAFAYSYLGHIGQEAATGRGGLIRAGLIAIGVLSAMSFLTMFVKRLRGAKDDTETMLVTDALSLNRRLDSNEDLLVVDVRGSDEFNGNLGHIKGALNIPLGELPSRISELRGHRARPIVVVCLTDKRSAKAIQLMQAGGLSALTLLRGGMKGWAAARCPIEDGSARAADS